MLEILYENFIYHGDVPCWGEKQRKNNKKNVIARKLLIIGF